MAEPADFTQYKTDHDLLIELRTEFRGMRNDINEIKTGTVARIADLEGDHVKRTEFETLENEVENLKLWRSYLLGAWAICILILIPIAFAYFR
jgi:hypothetical protein